ncbi:MAG: zf-HC2 domain-containing protein [Acidimicrobiaceae bacterium]|jgi:anti-sigma factor RsiW|nr:zf-HC2 domain-containing protein [bacterium]MCO4833947.1 zf-HC2 domain-containing protein [Acidimicrobiaceae bacterium]MDB2391847.1 zf-HC2 domain-containing protein [Acidimicrobiaceae bacterium]
MNFLSRFFKRDMSCHQVAAVMQQYLDAELEPSQVPKVLKHLEACKDCGLEATMYTRIKDSLQNHQESPTEDSIARIRNLAEELAANGIPEAAE